MPTIEKVCKFCKKPFTYTPGFGTVDKRIYCGKDCKAMEAKRRTGRDKPREIPSRPCAVCGTPFVSPRSASVYCGKPCARRMRVQRQVERRRQVRNRSVEGYTPLNLKIDPDAPGWARLAAALVKDAMKTRNEPVYHVVIYDESKFQVGDIYVTASDVLNDGREVVVELQEEFKVIKEQQRVAGTKRAA